MRYHDITHDDMRNGDGLRVVLWVSGCNHRCPGCQNPLTWEPQDGLYFGISARDEIFAELAKDYISGLTISGGDPLYPGNRVEVLLFLSEVKERFPDKTVWLYTGYTWEQVNGSPAMYAMMKYVDVLVDGPFDRKRKDNNYHWAGSTNQRVIDVQKTLRKGEMILYEGR